MRINSSNIRSMNELGLSISRPDMGKHTVQISGEANGKAHECIKVRGGLSGIVDYLSNFTAIRNHEFVPIAKTRGGSTVYVKAKLAASVAAAVLNQPKEGRNSTQMAATISKVHSVVERLQERQFFSLEKEAQAQGNRERDTFAGLYVDDTEQPQKGVSKKNSSQEVVIGKIGGRWQAQPVEKTVEGGAAKVALTADVAVRRVLSGVDSKKFVDDVAWNKEYINMIRPGEGEGLGRMCQVVDKKGNPISDEAIIVSKRFEGDCLQASYKPREVPKMAGCIVDEVSRLADSDIHVSDLKLANISYEGKGVAKLQDVGRSINISDLSRGWSCTGGAVREDDMKEINAGFLEKDSSRVRDRAKILVKFELGIVLYGMAQKAGKSIDTSNEEELYKLMPFDKEDVDMDSEDMEMAGGPDDIYSAEQLQENLKGSSYTSAQKAMIVRLLHEPEKCVMDDVKKLFPR